MPPHRSSHLHSNRTRTIISEHSILPRCLWCLVHVIPFKNYKCEINDVHLRIFTAAENVDVGKSFFFFVRWRSTFFRILVLFFKFTFLTFIRSYYNRPRLNFEGLEGSNCYSCCFVDLREPLGKSFG